MEALVLENPGEFKSKDIESSHLIKPDHALVRVHRIGICGTDLHAFEGTQPFFSYPRILGHELGVEIIDISENTLGLKAGDRCAVEPYLNCGECIACKQGKTNCCESLKVLGVHLDGGMCDQFEVPITKLHKSDTLTLEQLALVETLGIGAHAVQRANLKKDEVVLIRGAGPIGLSTIEFAQVAETRIIVVEGNPKRLEFCMNGLGLKHCLDPSTDLNQFCKQHYGHLPNVIFDCTGNPKSMTTTFQSIANGGRIVFVGFYQGDITFNDQEFHRREVTLMSSRNAKGDDFKRIIQLLEDGKIDTTPWITQRVKRDELISEFPNWLAPETNVVKAMLEWE